MIGSIGAMFGSEMLTVPLISVSIILDGFVV
jgi:hypothetical protein